MKVRVTEDAASDVRGIKAFLANRSAIASDHIVDRIGKVISGLQKFPRLGHPGIVEGTFERIVPRTSYVIVYRIDVGDEDELVILRVYHTAQDRSGRAY